MRERLARTLSSAPGWRVPAELVRPQIEDRDEAVRWLAIPAAARLAELCESLLGLLARDEEEEVPAAAASALAEAPAPEALPALLLALAHDDGRGVRRASAATAERLLGRAGGWPAEAAEPAPATAEQALDSADLLGAERFRRLGAFPAARAAADADPEKLAHFGADLFAEAQAGRLPRAYGMERVVEAVLRVVRGGPAVQRPPRRSGRGQDRRGPRAVRTLGPEWRVVRASLSDMLAGTLYLGEWQTRVRDLITAASRRDGARGLLPLGHGAPGPRAGAPAPGPRHPGHDGVRDVLLALRESTGIPADFLDDDRPLDLAAVSAFFGARVMGQPEDGRGPGPRRAVLLDARPGRLRERRPRGDGRGRGRRRLGDADHPPRLQPARARDAVRRHRDGHREPRGGAVLRDPQLPPQRDEAEPGPQGFVVIGRGRVEQRRLRHEARSDDHLGGEATATTGNEVYAFSMVTFRWTRLTEPSSCGDDPWNEARATRHADGRPVSRHTYDYIDYIPPPVDRFFSGGGALWYASFSDPSSSTSTGSSGRRSRGVRRPVPAPAAPWDPAASSGSTGALHSYDATKDLCTGRADFGEWFGNHKTLAVDPVRRKLVAIGEGDAWMWDLERPDDGPVPLNAGGDGAIESAQSQAVDFDTIGGKLVAWSGGASV